jgi:glycosyltransferase involved in cell wall biosynthesis
MKITHCLFTMETGGSQILAVELLNELCAVHEVSLIIINNKYNERLLDQLDKRVSVYYINRKEGSKNPFPVIKLNWLLTRLKPDVVHCHEPKFAKMIALNRLKILYTIHDIGIPVAGYELYDKLVAISNAVCKDVMAKINFPVNTVYNGVSIKRYRQRCQYELAPGEVIKLVQVSRLFHEKKGQHILLQALHRIVYEYRFTGVSLDFIGSGNSIEYLTALVATLKLQDHVRFIGEKDRDWLFTRLCEYNILVQPSLYEGFGLTILEGFAAGLPVLASNIDGPAEIISKMPGGFLFNSGDTDSCSGELYKIIKLYTGNGMGSKMEQTISIVNQQYSIESCAREYLMEYMKIAN